MPHPDKVNPPLPEPTVGPSTPSGAGSANTPGRWETLANCRSPVVLMRYQRDSTGEITAYSYE